ncbi:MAG: GNAT family N-acetyltransferase [Candidatus Eremiobacteraeota bacterium]|nr:GNAT family N-acetyltransferase [Candidatus Eremiobacteraeota bacterium]
MNKVAVTHATGEDASIVGAILAEYALAVELTESDDQEAIARYLTPPCGFWLATSGEDVVGCVGVRPLGLGTAELKRLYVRPGHRGKGLADALLDAAEAFARATGAAWLYLDSTEDLLAAQRFYRRRGYAPCARYHDDPDVNVFLRRQL